MHSPEIIISSPDHHQAIFCSNLFPEVLHGFRVALQRILTNDKEDWSLHVQEGIVHILKEAGSSLDLELVLRKH